MKNRDRKPEATEQSLPQHLEPLALVNIDRLGDGQAGDAIKRAIETCLNDLRRYGGDLETREISVVIKIKQLKRNQPRVGVVFDAKAILPRPRTKKTIALFEMQAKSAELLFNPVSAENPNQMTFEFMHTSKE